MKRHAFTLIDQNVCLGRRRVKELMQTATKIANPGSQLVAPERGRDSDRGIPAILRRCLSALSGQGSLDTLRDLLASALDRIRNTCRARRRAFLRLRNTLIVIAALTGPGTLSCGTEPLEDRERPNIIEILVDDLGYGDLGAYGSDVFRTPHIDALSHDGVRFTNGYVTSPWCAPSRHALLSGCMPNRRSGFDRAWLGERLHNADYATGFIGKVHNHKVVGYDYFYGFFDGSSPYLPGNDRPLRMRRQTDGQGEIRPADCEEVVEPEYLTDGFTREAVGFICRNSQRPFVLCLHYNAPHSPLQATDKYLSRYPDLEGKMKAYAAMVSAIDDGIGRIVKELKNQGLYENTLITFLSDNGADWAWGREFDEKGALSGGLRSAKHSFYEGGIRVPYIIAWPSRLDRGVRFDRVACSLDLLPTFLSAAGVPYQEGEFDGVNLLPYLARGEQGNAHEYLYFQRSLSGEDKGIPQERLDQRSERIGDTPGEWIIRTEGWKAIGRGQAP
ncbi:sulfatase-like hydrolase/transferase, partial [bacterium]|nr:sulfatase-like hydrolase/transferase [bacterium]